MTKLLIVLVLILGILAIAQLARVYELTSSLRGKREEDISPADNRMNGRLMWLFLVVYLVFFIWITVEYSDKMLPVSASEHGVALDQLLNFNWVILIIPFFITNILLFYFAGKYYYRKDRKALYLPHNNKLELIWTIVPAAVLAVVIIYGLRTWNGITEKGDVDLPEVELYAKQFDWTARYPGPDGRLGATDFRLINGNNPLGIVTAASIEERLAEIDTEHADVTRKLETEVLPDEKMKELQDRLGYLSRLKGRIIALRTSMQEDIKQNGENSAYLRGADDQVVKEFHLPNREEVRLVIRSRDVLHSMYLPHMRAQMNAVPGMTTTFRMTPIITTDSMRLVMNNPEFNYVLLCNKICGASHYNMQMDLIVEDRASYDAWLATLAPFAATPEAGEEKGTDSGPEPAPAEGTPTPVAQANVTH